MEEEATKVYYNGKPKGGFRAASFVFAFLVFGEMAFVSNSASLVLYFFEVMHFDLPGSANTLTNLVGSCFFFSIVGAFVSDTYLSRYTTALIFGLVQIVGFMLMTIQANDMKLQPSPCDKSSCVKGGIAVMLYGSLYLFALGNGGIKGSVPALGADQFDRTNPKDAKALARYFNFLLLSVAVGSIMGVTLIVWVSMNKGWWYGFLFCTLVTSVGYTVVALGKPFYRIQAPGESPFLRIAQVFVVSFKNRRMMLPDSPAELYENKDMKEKILHTNQFGCLDKAAIVGDKSAIVGENGMSSPWKICTVTQVEEVKVLTRMMPILASTIILNTCLAQLNTMSIQQSNRMNLSLGSFKVPAGSIPVIPFLCLAILTPLYEFFFAPFARKITGHPSGITHLQRVGVGLVLSVISMTVAGFVEVKRRDRSLKTPWNPISFLWLAFQFGIFGIADLFTLVGLLEFFYKEAPAGMKSLSTSFTYISIALGFFLSSVLVDIINSVTGRLTSARKGWLVGQDIDRNRLDLFYWFIAILSFLNFLNYLYWASWYKYKTDEPKIEPVEVEKPDSGMPPLKEESTTMSTDDY